MKRRVGAVLVRDNRILATGYDNFQVLITFGYMDDFSPNSGIMAHPGAFPTAMRVDAVIVTRLPHRVRFLTSVFASTPKKMHCWKQGESVWGKMLSFIAIRPSLFPGLPKHRV